MKICFFMTGYHGNTSLTLYTKSLMNLLRDMNHNVDLKVEFMVDKEFLHSGDAFYFAKHPLFWPFFFRSVWYRLFKFELPGCLVYLTKKTSEASSKILSHVKWLDYDVLWIEYGIFSTIAELLPIVKQNKHRPLIILDYHGVTPPQENQRQKLLLLKSEEQIKKHLKFSDACIIHSEFIKKEIDNFSKLSFVTVLPLFLDSAKLMGENAEDVRKRYSWENKKILLYVGRVAQHKNIEVVIRAISLINENYLKDILFIIIGNFKKTPYHHEKKRLESIIKRLNLVDKVLFAGELDDKELNKYYASCDIFIMPSLHEGFCIPIIEAMAYGKPVIGANSTAIPETVGYGGILFNPDNPTELKERIEAILGNENFRYQLSKAAFRRVNEFSYEIFKINTNKLIGEINHLREGLNT